MEIVLPHVANHLCMVSGETLVPLNTSSFFRHKNYKCSPITTGAVLQLFGPSYAYLVKNSVVLYELVTYDMAEEKLKKHLLY